MQLSVVKGLHGVQRCVINAGEKRGDNFELFVEGTNFKELLGLIEINGWRTNTTEKMAKYYAGRRKNKKKVENARRQWRNKFTQLAKASRTTQRSNLAGTVSHEAGHAKITCRNSPRKFLKIKILSSKEGWKMHSGPNPETYTRTEMKRLMVLAVAGKVAEVKAVGHSTGWEEDEKDWCRVAKKMKILSAKAGWTLHSGPSPQVYTRGQMKRLMMLAVAGKVAELKAVGHSSGWEEDQKDWRRVAPKHASKRLAVTSARWAEIEGEEEKRAFVKVEVRRLVRWAMRTAREELDAEWPDVLRLCELLVREKTAGPAELREYVHFC
ncbi:hypothetical protein niasHT_003458 [Heterodera trifolii]|uniref:Uncharacterized protein n=1 Tax=Heterodera trifolii TaxID=157864 RepID=A0ABD2M1Z9_9BILA